MGQEPKGLHDCRRKAPGSKLFVGPAGILDYIMKEGRTRLILRLHLLRQVKGMKDIGHAALVGQVPVGFKTDLHGFFGEFCIEHGISPLPPFISSAVE